MLSGGESDTDGLGVEVHRWINDVEWNFFHGLAKVCNDGELEKEDVPA